VSLSLWSWLAQHPALYALAARFGVRYLNWLAGGEDRIRVLGLAPGWTEGRDFPAPQGRTFRELYKQGQESKT
jgi:L-lactate dehydrogenase complex protein LldF